MMSHSLGIQRDEKKPGYKHILLQPKVGEQLDYAKGGFESIYGYIASGWKKNGSTYEYRVTIPANTTATLLLPANKVADVKLLKGKEGAISTTFKQGMAKYELKSGTYEFSAPAVVSQK